MMNPAVCLAFALILLVTGPAVPAHTDVTPPGLQLTEGSVKLRNGTYTLDLHLVREDRRGQLEVSVQVTKNDREHGSLTMEQWLSVGGSIGVTAKPDADTLRKIPPKLRVLLNRDDPVEFDPQAKLLSARQHPEWPVRLCILVSIPDGVGCLESVIKRTSITVNEIVLLEKSGKRLVVRDANPPNKMPSSGSCSVHGGQITARLLTEEERREARAAIHLSVADEDWKSKNPKLRKRAQEAYLKLLKEFASESIVVKNRERISERAEAEIED